MNKIRVAICNLCLEKLNEEKLKAFGLDKGYDYSDGDCSLLYLQDEDDMVSFQRKPNIYELKLRLNKIVDDVLSVVEKENKPLVSIGVAVSAIYDQTTSEVKHSSGLDCLRNAKLSELLFPEIVARLKQQQILFSFEHDTESTLIYEREQLFRRDFEVTGLNNVAMVYLGTGMGASFIVNNQLYRAKLGASGEINNLRAPFIPDFNKRFSSVVFSEEKFPLNVNGDMGLEDNLHLRDIKEFLKPYLTIEDAIKYKVFNCKPYEIDKYKERISKENLMVFKDKYPKRYELLKQYTSYMTNILVNLLSMDVIIYSGAVFYWTKGLVEDLAKKQGEDAIMCLSDGTRIMPGSSSGDNTVALSAAYVAFFRCHDANLTEVAANKPIRVSWE